MNKRDRKNAAEQRRRARHDERKTSTANISKIVIQQINELPASLKLGEDGVSSLGLMWSSYILGIIKDTNVMPNSGIISEFHWCADVYKSAIILLAKNAANEYYGCLKSVADGNCAFEVPINRFLGTLMAMIEDELFCSAIYTDKGFSDSDASFIRSNQTDLFMVAEKTSGVSVSETHMIIFSWNPDESDRRKISSLGYVLHGTNEHTGSSFAPLFTKTPGLSVCVFSHNNRDVFLEFRYVIKMDTILSCRTLGDFFDKGRDSICSIGNIQKNISLYDDSLYAVVTILFGGIMEYFEKHNQ